MSAEAKNLERIVESMKRHDENCGAPLVAVLMSPFECDRLDWEQIRGVPIQVDDSLPTGRFRLLCSGQHGSGDSIETAREVPAVGERIAA